MVLCYHCGDSVTRKPRNWPSPRCAGALDIKICLLSHLAHVSTEENGKYSLKDLEVTKNQY